MDLDEAKGQALVKELGSNTKFFKADVSSYDSQARMFQEVWDTWHQIDALLANAGIVDRNSLYLLNWRDKNECVRLGGGTSIIR